MSDLVEFLLARVAEEERLARRVQQRTRHEPPATIGGIGDVGLVGYPYRRVLAECEAKRRIVEWWMAGRDGDESGYDTHRLLTALALPYADHPDYRQEWRP